MRILLWHVHGSWTTAFVQGDHDYVLPVLADRGPDGLGRARTWDWPASVIEAPPEQLADSGIEVVVLQRPHEVDLAERWLRRRPGRDVPAVFVEHNCPDGPPATTVHPLAGDGAIPIVHVTWFNQLMWDTGRARSEVIEHGVVDPGYRFTGELARAAAVINDPCRRGRTTGTDLLEHWRRSVEIDLFGMRTEALGGRDLPQSEMHAALGRYRVYAHPNRWTSLGLSLIEAMMLGLPVVALSVTEAAEVIPPEAGVVTNRPEAIEAALRRFVEDPEHGRRVGLAARSFARRRFGLERFLADWDRKLQEVTA